MAIVAAATRVSRGRAVPHIFRLDPVAVRDCQFYRNDFVRNRQFPRDAQQSRQPQILFVFAESNCRRLSRVPCGDWDGDLPANIRSHSVG